MKVNTGASDARTDNAVRNSILGADGRIAVRQNSLIISQAFAHFSEDRSNTEELQEAFKILRGQREIKIDAALNAVLPQNPQARDQIATLYQQYMATPQVHEM